MRKLISCIIISCIIISIPVLADHHKNKDMDKETMAKIKRAMSAAPSMISKNATVLDLDGTVLKEGSNGWTCYPGVPLIPDSKDPMCNDAVWQAWIAAAAKGETFETKTIGFSYMLQGDGLVSNDDPMATDKTKGVWIKEGPHLMLLVPKSALGDTPNTPEAPGPYVMWGDTPMVHIMVPTTDRPEGALIKHHH